MLFTKKVRLNWYSPMKFFFRKIQMTFDIENSLWKSKIGNFDELSPDGDLKSGNFIWLQLILGQKPRFLGPIQLVTQKVNIHYYQVHYCVILQKPMEFNVYSPDHGSLICPLEPNLGRISGGVQAVGYNWK